MSHPNTHPNSPREISARETLYSADDIAEILGVSRRTLARWHALRTGPARCKIGRKVYYRLPALNSWLDAHESLPPRSIEKAA
ncbi:helix-turn-helix domain-containing protein [Albimonas sp. CAU 1670]|uniref:helix-turn-helix transcriptional regulator n=1 Tax=Albimonas sp. CAU 1670 TaxID=3032599 RepID=UPI0023DBACA6|nr:helix-turn-helix domain-containing protein [Albimonas sp. CAU 1670]MDF2235110.1 helix-turn-helix domain-containing protein [Albimonas sp. CAU 1670]